MTNVILLCESEDIPLKKVCMTGAKILALVLVIAQLLTCLAFTVTADTDTAANAESGDGAAQAISVTASGETKNIVGHPRVYFTEDDVTQLRDIIKLDENDQLDENSKYVPYAPQDLKSKIINTANSYLDETELTIEHAEDYVVTYPIPFQNPPATTNLSLYPWTALSRQIQLRIQSLTMAYVITEDEKYYDRVKLLAMSVVDNFVDWTDMKRRDPGKLTNLDTTHLTTSICTFYDIFYDRLTPEERTKIKDTVYEKAILKFQYDFRSTEDNNIFAARAAAYLMAVCTFYDEIEDPETHIQTAKDYISLYFKNRAESGDHEGAMYTSLAVDSIMPGLDALARVVGDTELLADEWLNKDLFEWLIAISENTGGAPANISDSSYSSFFFVTASILAKWNQNPLAAYYVTSRWTSASDLEYFTYMYDYSQIDYSMYPNDDLQAKFCSKVGMTSLRTGWSYGDTLFVLTAGESDKEHNHYDSNSFVIAKNSAWLANDPGYANIGDDYAMSFGHSTIFVDGKGQNSKGRSQTEVKMLAPFFSYVIGSAANAYKTSGVKQFDRNVMMINHTFPYYVIMDQIDGLNSHEYQWRYNADNAKSIEVEGEEANMGTIKTGSSINIVNDRASIAINFASADPLNIKCYKYGTNTSSQLIDVTTQTKSTNAEYLAILSPYAGASVTYDMTESFDKVELSNDDAEVSNTKADVSGMILFKPEKTGDKMTLPLSVMSEGSYTLTFKVCTGNLYGSMKIYIDGEEITTFDSYVDDYLDTTTFTVENVNLDMGDHKVTVEALGTDGVDTANYVGLISIKLDIADISGCYVKVKETLTDDSVLGFVSEYGTKGATDTVIFARKDGEGNWNAISSGNVETDGSAVTVLGVIDGAVKTGLGASDVTSVKYAGKELFSSPAKASVSLNYGNSSKSEIDLEEDAEVRFYLPTSDDMGTVTVNGEEVEPAVQDNIVTLKLTAGENTIDFGFAAEEDAGSVNWTLIIIIIAAAAVIAAAIVVALILTKKKKASVEEKKD